MGATYFGEMPPHGPRPATAARDESLACVIADLHGLSPNAITRVEGHGSVNHVFVASSDTQRFVTESSEHIRARASLSDAHWEDHIAKVLTPDIAEHIPLDLFGLITGLPAETARIPWDGPQVRIIEHQAHAPGHAALLIEERGVLVAGDMLSDVLIPMLDLNAADPIEDYLAALRLLEGVADNVDVLVPGHGSIGGADQVDARIEQDRAYVHTLRDAGVPADPRVGPSATFDWLPTVHERQLQQLAQRREHDGTSG